jgi:hypothetical protein
MRIVIIIVFLLGILFFSNIASAHVPYFEHRDLTEEKPFIVGKRPEQSKAIYAWLETDFENPCKDIDVYTFEIKDEPILVYIEIIVPVVDEFYKDFVPWYALVGPDLPEPSIELPFEIPDGYGAIIKENVEPGTERETFYEPFGGKSYYSGPIFEQEISKPGTYYVYSWDPYESGGDYTMVLGKGEFFGFLDIIRALIYTPLIRWGFELHVP